MIIMLHDVYYILGIPVDGPTFSSLPNSGDSKAAMTSILGAD